MTPQASLSRRFLLVRRGRTMRTNLLRGRCPPRPRRSWPCASGPASPIAADIAAFSEIVLARPRTAPLANATQQCHGSTADLLLELDEAQDLTEQKVPRDYRPDVTFTNATTMLYGMAWDLSNPLKRQ
jgi:hypothetical protein